jgi:hypothetical protein
MAVEYDIAPATSEDAILALEEENLSGSSGRLFVRLPADWLERAMQKMPLSSVAATARLSLCRGNLTDGANAHPDRASHGR